VLDETKVQVGCSADRRQFAELALLWRINSIVSAV